MFKKIYNEIKYLCKVATAGSKEARELEKVKKAFENAWKDSVTAENNTTDGGDVKFSIKNIDLNKIQSMYGIKDLKDYVHVQKKVFDKLTQTGFFDKNGSKVVINKATGIVVEINKSGIKETFGKGKRYEFQSKENKILKLATVGYLDEIIENAIVYSKSENYHNNDSQVEYLYLKHGVKINGKPYIIAVDIRMSPDKNKFWLHRMYDVTKENQQSFGEAKNNLKHPYLTIADEDSKPQNTKNVNTTDEKRQDRDSLGHTLTKAQQSYFVESKIRDENGNLKVMYHGSPETFTIFDRKKARSGGTYGSGFYFTDSKSHAGTYGDSYVV